MNNEHYEILNEGVNEWNKWRKINKQIIPDLSAIHFINKILDGADFSKTIFDDAILNNIIYIYLCLCSQSIPGNMKSK